MSNIDEAALKAGISEPVASELPLDVDGLFMHLKILGLDNERLCKQALRIAIASRSQPVAAEQAEDFTTQELERLAQQAGMITHLFCGSGSCVKSEGCNGVTQEHLESFARLCRNREAGGS